MPRRLLLIGIVIVLFLVVSRLASCGRGGSVELPKGEQTFTGVLTRAEIARGRRGTHFLTLADGSKCCLVESSTVNLRDLEGVSATFKGTFVANIDPQYLPVLVVTAATAKGLSTRDDALQSVGVHVSVPDDWQLKLEDKKAVYALSGVTIMTVALEPKQDIPQGNSIGVGTKIGVRTEDALTGEQVTYLAYNGGTLVLRYLPIKGVDLEAKYRRVVNTVKFDVTSTTLPTTGSGNAAGRSCGGIAGFVCPEGYLCQVSGGLENSTGSCVPVGS